MAGSLAVKRPAKSPATPQAYLASLPAERQAALQFLHERIQAAVPKLAPFMIAGMIGYGKYRYKSASGREGDWFIIGLAARKNYISLYLCAVENGGYLAEQNAPRLGKVKAGRSCITFKQLEDLNLPVAISLVKRAAKLGGMNQFAM